MLDAVGTRDPFSAFLCGEESPVPFIDDLRHRLHALAVEALHGASLAELTSPRATQPEAVDLGTLQTDGRTTNG